MGWHIGSAGSGDLFDLHIRTNYSKIVDEKGLTVSNYRKAIGDGFVCAVEDAILNVLELEQCCENVYEYIFDVDFYTTLKCGATYHTYLYLDYIFLKRPNATYHY